MDKKVFERTDFGGFIKETDEPSRQVSGEQKARLNRQGNELLYEGDIERARRIFQTTGYSDGLIRVGDRYMNDGNNLKALKMYKLAHENSKSEAIIQKIAFVIQNLLREEEMP